MASKKDKLTKKIQEEIQKNISSSETENTYQNVINEIQNKHIEDQVLKNTDLNQDNQESTDKQDIQNTIENQKIDELEKIKETKKNQDKINYTKNSENMSTKRDSVYNVSADLRLEDYVDDKQKKEYGPIIRNVLIILLILLLITGIWKLGVYLFAPKYYLSISNTEITDENYKSFLDNNQIPLYTGQLLHIRFTYLEKKSDYYTIQILKEEAGNLSEEAILGRKIPKTVNYIYFAGPVDPGSYIVKVLDRDRKIILERKIDIITP